MRASYFLFSIIIVLTFGSIASGQISIKSQFQITIPDSVASYHNLFVLDVNRDGDLDILFKSPHHTAWYSIADDRLGGFHRHSVERYSAGYTEGQYDNDDTLDYAEIVLLNSDSTQSLLLVLYLSSRAFSVPDTIQLTQFTDGEDRKITRVHSYDSDSDGIMEISVTCTYHTQWCPPGPFDPCESPVAHSSEFIYKIGEERGYPGFLPYIPYDRFISADQTDTCGIVTSYNSGSYYLNYEYNYYWQFLRIDAYCTSGSHRLLDASCSKCCRDRSTVNFGAVLLGDYLGDVLPDNPGSEYIAAVLQYFSYGCGGIVVDSLFVLDLSNPDEVSRLLSHEMPEDLDPSAMFTDSRWPGTLFAYSRGPLNLWNLNDMAHIQTYELENLNGGLVGYYRIFPGEDPYMVLKTSLTTFDLVQLDLVTDVGHTTADLPDNFYLSQNYPNPFNPSTEITYSIATGKNISLTVFNTLGQEVAVLVNQFVSAGNHTVKWNGTDEDGNPVASGIYLYRLRSGDMSETRKMLLLK